MCIRLSDNEVRAVDDPFRSHDFIRWWQLMKYLMQGCEI